MDLIIKDAHRAVWNGREIPCAVGRNGFVKASEKVELDGKTPIGHWTIREVFFRADRLEKPVSVFPTRALSPDDGWCDASDDPNYNRFVKHHYPASAEKLWRDDHLYDIVVVIGHNDNPPIPGKGSAIFFHIAKEDFGPTDGCVAVSREDLLSILREADSSSAVCISPQP